MEQSFASAAWVEALQHAINHYAPYQESARSWEGDFHFVIEPDGPGTTDTVVVYLDLWHGNCRAARLAGADDAPPEFVIRGPQRNWVRVLRRELDPIKALMTGALKLKGNFAKVLKNVRAAQDLVVAASTVPTAFPPA
jgi:putative sterol carrier protein